MNATELRTFTDEAPDAIHHTDVISAFESMLAEADPTGAQLWIDRGTFYKREWRERITPKAFRKSSSKQ